MNTCLVKTHTFVGVSLRDVVRQLADSPILDEVGEDEVDAFGPAVFTYSDDDDRFGLIVSMPWFEMELS